jgi:hypothetical protein
LHNVLFHEVRGVKRVLDMEVAFEETAAVAQPTVAFDMRAKEVVEPLASLSLEYDNTPWCQLCVVT